jgi:maltose alpha-D-glucosyltransferase / alpha-amylase
MICRPRRIKAAQGEIEAVRLPELRRIMGESPPSKPSSARNEQSNSCVVFEDKLMLKLFRRLEPGLNPELEMGRFLNSHSFPYCQSVAGGLEYLGPDNFHLTLAVVHAFIPSATNAWDFTLDSLGRYYDRVITWVAQGQSAAVPLSEPVQLLHPDFPSNVAETIGTFLESARLLGVHTAELHRVLASDIVNKNFAPEPSTPHHCRAVFQSMRNLAVQNLRLLRRQSNMLRPETQPLAQKVVELESTIIQSYRALCDLHVPTLRLRLHGDCQLGQVLWTGKDFVFIDFEGDSSAPISERRLKHSPLRDVATMLRSFHHAAAVGLDQHAARGSIPPENMLRFQSWLRYWNLWVSVAYLKAYFQTIGGSRILPDHEESVRVMLRAHLLDRTMNELGRELRDGGGRLEIPLSAVLFLLREAVPEAPAVKTPLAQLELAH